MANYWFISTQYQRCSKLALFTFLLAFIVILLGAYTRLTDAGLSCPDWPHCYGYITAPHTAEQLQNAVKNFPAAPVNIEKAWTEMMHRYFAGFESLLIFALAGTLFAMRSQNQKGADALLIPSLLIVLLSVQVILGMLTVTAKLKPIIVLSHLLTGLSILSVLWGSYLTLTSGRTSFIKKSPSSYLPWLCIAFFIVFLQITLGGWVSTHYAGLACIDLPYCNGKFLPHIQWDNLNQDLIGIHMLHRFGAIITAIYIVILSSLLYAKQPFRKLAIIMLSLVLLQFTLGILNILWLRPIWIALAHQGIAIILLLTTLTGAVKAFLNTEQHYDYA